MQLKRKINSVITNQQATANSVNSEKLNYFQKVLIIRWINSLDVWPVALKTENMMEELKTGVLLCNILKFH